MYQLLAFKYKKILNIVENFNKTVVGIAEGK